METVDDPALQAWFVGTRARVGVRIVGLLDRMWIPVSDFDVTPIVALAAIHALWGDFNP